ncbi:MAG: C40 family peptidase [Corynebacterium sp.]|uniref:C40 family peptidase n=1 Tax=Corynebacterium sp. TaxID=1720 RepID=UPI0026DC928E|nr:C40 family peptidase [Corynebacterium sp.]MDO5097887.1 C40 family peptidase [Corynebacterium sp.]
MAKHRRQNNNVVRNTAAATAAAAVATMVNPAQAAEVVVPGTDVRFEVAGVENVQGIADVPGANQWIPSLKGQGNANYSAVVENPFEAVQPVQTQSVGDKILAAARSKIGAPYVWGATGPNAFDCSGLTSWAYNQVGKQIPRTSYAQAAQGQKVSRENLQPGDIVVFYSGASHVGIYAGDGKVVHAVTQGTPLQEAPMGNMPFHSAVRF